MSFSWANIALNGAEGKIKNSIATQQPHHFLSSWFHSFKTTHWWNWSKKVKGVTKGLKTVAMTLLFLITDSIAWWGVIFWSLVDEGYFLIRLTPRWLVITTLMTLYGWAAYLRVWNLLLVAALVFSFYCTI